MKIGRWIIEIRYNRIFRAEKDSRGGLYSFHRCAIVLYSDKVLNLRSKIIIVLLESNADKNPLIKNHKSLQNGKNAPKWTAIYSVWISLTSFLIILAWFLGRGRMAGRFLFKVTIWSYDRWPQDQIGYG